MTEEDEGYVFSNLQRQSGLNSRKFASEVNDLLRGDDERLGKRERTGRTLRDRYGWEAVHRAAREVAEKHSGRAEMKKQKRKLDAALAKMHLPILERIAGLFDETSEGRGAMNFAIQAVREIAGRK